MDIRKAKIVACCLDEKNQQEIRTFGTMTRDLIELANGYWNEDSDGGDGNHGFIMGSPSTAFWK